VQKSSRTAEISTKVIGLLLMFGGGAGTQFCGVLANFNHWMVVMLLWTAGDPRRQVRDSSRHVESGMYRGGAGDGTSAVRW